MARFPFLQRSEDLPQLARGLTLAAYNPSIALEALVTGVDNVRHDVHLSPRFVEVARSNIFKLIAKYGSVEDLVAEESGGGRPPSVMRPPAGAARAGTKGSDASDFKRMLSELLTDSLRKAKAESNISVDLLARVACIKFLRGELATQFNAVVERCKQTLKEHEGPRQMTRSIQMRERFAGLQVGKRAVLRRVGQEVVTTLRDVEKETLARMRRSLVGDAADPIYELFINRLLMTEDGRDDYLNAEHYVMLGNYERDPDRFQSMLDVACGFLRSLGISYSEDAGGLDALLSAPANAEELVGGGTPDESTPKGKAQRSILNAWVELLEREQVLQHVIASYEAAPLLAQYSPPINPQQLKNALIAGTERKLVETLLEEHGKISPENLHRAMKKVAGCKGAERSKVAGRFLRDFIRYHRDLRKLEAVNGAMERVNVIASDKLRQLSSINNTLYEFTLSEEQKPVEDKIIHHVILKADIRESTTLTRTLFERGLNPASYFSLNFYEPVNKLLAKYAATKVFIEGDAVILALFDREGEGSVAVARACVLAKEIIEIVRAYNERSRQAGLPILELGIGISYQESAPMYLMDGNSRIMISRALNESDRLSSCTKGARRVVRSETPFSVYSFQTVEDEATGGNPDEFLMRYNVGGIHINEAAFRKLTQEISLQPHEVKLRGLWEQEIVRLYSGMVPVGQGSFHKLVVRQARIPYVDMREFKLKQWTDRCYYEVCTHPKIYAFVDSAATATATAD